MLRTENLTVQIDEVAQFMAALQEAQAHGGLPTMPLPEWAEASVARVVAAAGVDVVVKLCPTQAESIRILGPENTPLGRPVITLRPTFLAVWQSDPDAPSVLLSIAHELGHFARGHLDRAERPSPVESRALELEADHFAGQVARRLGLTREDLVAWIDSLNDPEGCATHPPHVERKAAALAGFGEPEAPVAPSSVPDRRTAEVYPSVGRPRAR